MGALLALICPPSVILRMPINYRTNHAPRFVSSLPLVSRHNGDATL